MVQEMFPKVTRGKVLKFAHVSCTVVDYSFVPSPNDGTPPKYILLLLRVSPATPYIVTSITPASWSHKEWGHGRYCVTLPEAVKAFAFMTASDGQRLSGYPEVEVS